MLHHRVSFANICNGKACLNSDSLFGVSSLLPHCSHYKTRHAVCGWLRVRYVNLEETKSERGFKVH